MMGIIIDNDDDDDNSYWMLNVQIIIMKSNPYSRQRIWNI